jgi:hypothetical protein
MHTVHLEIILYGCAQAMVQQRIASLEGQPGAVARGARAATPGYLSQGCPISRWT